jgi:hypothetical protein
MERSINKFIHNYLLALLHTNLVLQGGDSAFNKFLFITNEFGKALGIIMICRYLTPSGSEV